MTWVVLFVSILIVGMAAGALFVRSLSSAIILLSALSLFVSILFLLVAAPDVAITEATIGSALTTVVFVLALVRTGGARCETEPRPEAIVADDGESFAPAVGNSAAIGAAGNTTGTDPQDGATNQTTEEGDDA